MEAVESVTEGRTSTASTVIGSAAGDAAGGDDPHHG
jgi:hypothetical protein